MAGNRERRVGHRSKLDGMDMAGFYFYLSFLISSKVGISVNVDAVNIFTTINFIVLDSEGNTDYR